MNQKVWGSVLGVAQVFLWFMPFAYVEFMGREMHQAGNNVGGIAYLLLFSSFAYSVLSWLELHIPSIIAGSVSALICLLFLWQAGSSSAWGLVILTGASIGSIVLAAIANVQKVSIHPSMKGPQIDEFPDTDVKPHSVHIKFRD